MNMDRTFCCCWCSSSKQSQHDLHRDLLFQFEPESDSLRDSPERVLLFSVPSEYPSYSSSPSTVQYQTHSANEVHKSRVHRYRVLNPESKPELECFVIPSYGSSPPSTVAVKQRAGSSFLKGVGDDSRIIQKLIKEDSFKELGEVRIMCHFEQVKLAEFMKMIEDKMYTLKLHNRDKGRKFKRACTIGYMNRLGSVYAAWSVL